MANFRKSFNFRNGVQVDNDNLVVNSNGLVGIGTTVPTEILDVRGTTKVVGLVTASDVYTSTLNVSGVGTVVTLKATNTDVSGILTASQLQIGSSPTVGNLIGYAYTAWITDNGGVGLHTASKVGIGTTTSPGSGDNQLEVYGSADVTGTVTAAIFSGSGASLTNIPNNATTASSSNDASAIVTRDSSGNFSAGTITASLTGTASTAQSLTGSPNITVTDVSATNLSSGIITATTEINVGSGGTALTSLNSGRLGIGTANPTAEIQIRKASESLLEVVSDSGQSTISVGQSVGAGNSTGLIRFGSSSKSFDILNNDTGNMNFYLHGGTGVGNTGNYRWYYGKSLGAPLMSLTYGGRLGIAKTNPDQTLHVVGTSTVTSTAYFGGDLRAQDIYFTEIKSGGIVRSNTNTSSGVSTFYDVEVTNSLGIGTDNVGSNSFRIRDGLDSNLGTRVNIGVSTSGDATYFASNLTADTSQLKVFGNSYVGNTLYIRGSSEVSGVVTATNGFTSGTGTAVQISVSGSTLTFNVPGVGSTSLTLS